MEQIGQVAARVVENADRTHRGEILRPANREEWLALRKNDVTASVAGALLGIHPYTTPYRMWAEKTGQLADVETTRAMQRGTAFEPVAIDLLRRQNPDWSVRYENDLAYYRDPEVRLGATPDAFAHRPDMEGLGVVQVKSVSEHAFRQSWLDPDTREVVLPLWIAVQTICEAELTGSPWGTVVAVKTPAGLDEMVDGLIKAGCEDIHAVLHDVAMAWLAIGKLEVHVIDVPVHANVRRKLREAVADFWRVIDAGEKPPIDWSRDGETVLDIYRDSDPVAAMLPDVPAFEGLVASYAEAKAKEREAKAEADSLKPQIFEMLGNAEMAETDGWKVTAKTQHRKSYVVKESSSRVLRVKQKVEA